MCLDAWMIKRYQTASHGFYDVARDNLVWALFLKRVKADVRLEDRYGDTCWSTLVRGFCRWSRCNESVHARIFAARVKGLLEMHADPCMISGQGLTPTFQAFICYDSPWGIDLKWGEIIGSFWISILRASNIDVTAVARHSFRICRTNDNLLRKLHSYCGLDQRNHYQSCLHGHCAMSRFQSTKDLEDFLLDAFGKCGIYPDESWWMQGKERNEWDMSTTSIDFIPQTMYDAEKQDMVVKRRKGRRWQE